VKGFGDVSYRSSIKYTGKKLWSHQPQLRHRKLDSFQFPFNLGILPHELNAADSQGDENDDPVSLSCQAPVPIQQGFFFSGSEGSTSASIQQLGTLALPEINPTMNGFSAPVEPANTDLQLGMVMLPNDLVVDPRFSALENSLFSSMPHPDGVRLWAKHFAPLGISGGINIPKSWSDFFTVNLLNPSRFAWAKSFLESAAWNLIVQDREGETCFTFSIPKDCPLNETSVMLRD
jgi:hypothetical protein